MATRSVTRGPAERGRWAPSPQSLKCEVVHARSLVRPQFDPAAIAKCQGKPNTDEPPAIALARLGTVSARFPAVERMRSEQACILLGRPSRRRKRAARLAARAG